jgi:hypothetical protein
VYLEVTLKYVDACAEPATGSRARYEPADVNAALDHIIAEAEKLLRVARADTTRARIGTLITRCRTRRGSGRAEPA